MKEIWKDIKGYEGEYQISNKGRIKSLSKTKVRDNITGITYKTKEKIMRPACNKKGYLGTMIGRNGKTKSVKVHRLVAEAFIPNPLRLHEVNHIDGNKSNNSVENLEWVTHQENMAHAARENLMNKKSKLSRYEIHNMREQYIPKDPEYGATAFAKKYNMSDSHITRIIHGDVCKIEHFDSSAIKDEWCVCPKCGRKLFKIDKDTYIEHLRYTCDYKDCKYKFEVNTPVLDKCIDKIDRSNFLDLPKRGDMKISEYRELKKKLHVCRDCNRVDERTLSGKTLCTKCSEKNRLRAKASKCKQNFIVNVE